MADTKITGLTALTTPAAADLIAVVDDVVGTPTTKKVALSDLLTSYIEANISIQEANISDLGTYLTDIVSDTTPQLGGSLDVNGNKIVSVSNGNIDIEPNGTGNVLLGNFVFDADQTVGAGQDNYVLTYDNGTGLISLEASAGGGGGGAFTADGNSLISPTTSPTLNQATGNEVAFTLDYTVDKATSGNDTGLLVSMTDTASPGTSLLADFQVGGFSILNLNANGTFNVTDNSTRGLQYAAATAGLSVTYDSAVCFLAGRTFKGASLTGSWVASTSMFGFNSSSTLGSGSIDVRLYRDAANTLALRNSTNAQTFNLYGTYTDASNYERLEIKYSSTLYQIGAFASGTGTQRNLALYRGATNHIQLENGRTVFSVDVAIGQSAELIFSNGANWSRGINFSAGGGIAITDGGTGGESLEMREITAPSAPSANAVYIYAEDNGSGKTRLMALFATGAAQQIAIEP